MEKYPLVDPDEFAEKGTVKHFALSLGFMPHDNEQAEKILEGFMGGQEKEIAALRRQLLFNGILPDTEHYS